MALNREYAEADNIPLPVDPGVESGDPVVVGDLPAVATIDRQADGKASCQTNGAYRLPVKGVGISGNSAIDVGAILHLQSNGDINKKTDSGKRFGYALEAVESGATSEIPVKIGY